MNSSKLKKLFAHARACPAPPPSPDFVARVRNSLRTVRPEPGESNAMTLMDYLSVWFPQLACSFALLIALCLLADFYSSRHSQSGLNVELTQASDQWLFPDSEN